MAADTLALVFARARALVGALAPDEVYTDARLGSFAPGVYREIQRRFAMAGHVLLSDYAQFNVTAGVLSVGAATVGWPGTPDDNLVIKPTRLWERPQASVLFSDFVEMEEVDPYLIPRAQTTVLTHYEWGGRTIDLVGSSVNTTIRMAYAKYLAPLTGAAGDVLLIPDSVEAMAYGVAAEAVTSRGAKEKGEAFFGQFGEIVERMIQSDAGRLQGA